MVLLVSCLASSQGPALNRPRREAHETVFTDDIKTRWVGAHAGSKFVCSVARSCLTLCNPMDCMPDFPVPHHLTEFVQVDVHCISDAIQPSHPLMPSSPSVLRLSQHQGLFPVSRLFASGDQTTGTSASTSVLPKSIQG